MTHWPAVTHERTQKITELDALQTHDEWSGRSHRRAAISKRFLQPIGEQAYGSSSGYLYAARSYARTLRAPRTVAIYLSLNDAPVEFLMSGVRHRATAIAFKPMISRTVMDHGSGLVCVKLNPRHPNYRQFSLATAEKIIVLDRRAFAPLDGPIREASLGGLDLDGGLQVLSQIVSIAAKDLPYPEPLDARVQAVIELLQTDATRSLLNLSSHVGLSYYRLAHLFSNCLGISLRNYQLWLKLDRTWRLIEQGYEIADIAKLAGFSDMAHLCHAFQASYGVPIARHLRNLSNKMDFSIG